MKLSKGGKNWGFTGNILSIIAVIIAIPFIVSIWRWLKNDVGTSFKLGLQGNSTSLANEINGYIGGFNFINYEKEVDSIILSFDYETALQVNQRYGELFGVSLVKALEDENALLSSRMIFGIFGTDPYQRSIEHLMNYGLI